MNFLMINRKVDWVIKNIFLSDKRKLFFLGLFFLLDGIWLNAQNAKELAKEGYELALMGNYEQSKEKYLQAVSLSPTTSIYYYYIGLCEFEIGEDSLAVHSFTKAINLLKNRPDYFFYRGRANAELKRFDEAITDYDSAIYLDPFLTDYYVHRGRVKAALKLHEQGVADFSKAIEIDPRMGDPYVDRARSYLALEIYDKACQDLELAVKRRAFNAKYLFQTHCK